MTPFHEPTDCCRIPFCTTETDFDIVSQEIFILGPEQNIELRDPELFFTDSYNISDKYIIVKKWSITGDTFMILTFLKEENKFIRGFMTAFEKEYIITDFTTSNHLVVNNNSYNNGAICRVIKL
jgi:hypothetical protein